MLSSQPLAVTLAEEQFAGWEASVVITEAGATETLEVSLPPQWAATMAVAGNDISHFVLS
jgi:hypothetical protein